MGRSKEMGKPVAELTPDELKRERSRCRAWIDGFGNSVAAKLLKKRLIRIEKRMSDEARNA